MELPALTDCGKTRVIQVIEIGLKQYRNDVIDIYY
jgi:hypothetical protein